MAAAEPAGAAKRATKGKKKTDAAQPVAAEEGAVAEAPAGAEMAPAKKVNKKAAPQKTAAEEEPVAAEVALALDTTDTSKPKKKILKPLSTDKMAAFQQKAKQKGVVYLPRIPPFMKPEKIRHLLAQHAEVLRVYLAPESNHPTRPPEESAAERVP
jgi:ESF2/ABP1 family protein